MPPLRLILASLVAGSVLGCGEHEGDAPGECTNGADDDRDGYFDCDDLDCVMSPDCDGEGGDDTGDTGDTGQPDDDAPDPALLPPKTVEIDYNLGITFDFPVFGMDDCVMTFRGVGTGQTEVVGQRLTLEGTWQPVASTCPEDLGQIVWTTDGPVYHSFIFEPGGGRLDAWFAHEDLDDHHVDGDPVWYVTEMEVPVSADRANWELDEPVAQIYGTLEHDLVVRFGR